MASTKLRLLFLLSLFPLISHAATSREIWDEQCAKCHGANGDGKTKTAKKLGIKDYTNPKVQSEFSDVGLLKNLMLGVAGENDAERMPAYKEKMTVAEAKELIAMIRSFRK